MTGERTEKAIARIDLALRRLETAAARAQSLMTAQHQRNGKLKQAITETLRDLDMLINSEDGA